MPCYNESKRLRTAEFTQFLDTAEPGTVLIFVDDGSRDDTQQILGRLRDGREDRVVLLSLPRNRGKAEAVRSGVNYALGQDFQFVGFWDADLATPLAAIAEFLDLLARNPELDMVFGSRVKLLGRKVERRAVRHYVGRAFATVVSMILSLPIYDTQCGAKIFRCTPQLHAVFQEPFLSRWVFDVEIIARYISVMETPTAAAQRIYEYPLLTWKDVAGSKLKASDFASAAWDLLRIHWKYR